MADLKEGSTNNKAGAAAITKGMEFFLMVQECQKQGFLEHHKLLSQPTIWICNMAAIMDMMPHAKGMVGIKSHEHCHGQ